jgi:hypothetical protein
MTRKHRTEKADIVVMVAKMATGIVKMNRKGRINPYLGLRRVIFVRKWEKTF